MTKQQEALRLADDLERAVKQEDADDQLISVARWFVNDAAADVRQLRRRLHEVHEDDMTILAARTKRMNKLHAENVALHQRHHDDNEEYTRVLAENEALRALLNKFEYSSDGFVKRYPNEAEVIAVLDDTRSQT